MMPKRFNSLLILNFHKTGTDYLNVSGTDYLNVLAVANEFVSKFDERKKTFGLFLLRRIWMLNDCDILVYLVLCSFSLLYFVCQFLFWNICSKMNANAVLETKNRLRHPTMVQYFFCNWLIFLSPTNTKWVPEPLFPVINIWVLLFFLIWLYLCYKDYVS